jgi:peroxiredoxin
MTARAASLAFIAVLALAFGCARPPVMGKTLSPRELAGTDGAAHSLPSAAPDARLTVLVFFAAHCPCQAAHDARMLELYARYRPLGVDFVAVDPETGSTPERDASEVAKRGYPFPILVDPGATLARELGAEYATESFVLDREGTVRYHGGLDSDRKTLHDDATPYLREALDDLLARRPVRHGESKALGCALQTM